MSAAEDKIAPPTRVHMAAWMSARTLCGRRIWRVARCALPRQEITCKVCRAAYGSAVRSTEFTSRGES
jgi:hypothetical protein